MAASEPTVVPHGIGHEAAAVAGRSARTCVGSRRDRAGRRATRVWASARRAPKGPHRRPVWVNPCSSTSGGPDPRTSTWSATGDERTGHLLRHLGRRVGRTAASPMPWCARARARRRWPWRWRRTPAHPRASRRAQRGLLRARARAGQRATGGRLRDQRNGGGRAASLGGRGPPRRRPAPRVHRRPPPRAARHRRPPDHRAGRDLRSAVRWAIAPGVPDAVAAHHLAASGRAGLVRSAPRRHRAGPGPPQPGLSGAPDRVARPPARAPGPGPRARAASRPHRRCPRRWGAGAPARGRPGVAAGRPGAAAGTGRAPALARSGRPAVGLPRARDDRRRRRHRPVRAALGRDRRCCSVRPGCRGR